MCPQKITFQQAMKTTLIYCKAWEKEELSDEVLADKVATLLQSKNGARGFFVISLSSDCPLMDRLPDALVMNLRTAGEIVVDLTVRNLAMSTAMSVHHQRNKDRTLQAGSERVISRCLDILRLMDPFQVKKRMEKMLEGTIGKGDDIAFLEKWGYDKDQKIAIASSINKITEL